MAAAEKIPAVVYCKAIGNIPVEVNVREVEEILTSETGRNTLINLEINGQGQERESKVLIKEVQYDPIRHELIHVDFQQISLTECITTTVPVELTGEPAGVVQGGILQQQLRELEISCLPAEIPEAITVDISGLGLGESPYVRDLPVPAGVKVLSDAEGVVATVVAPAVEQAPEREPAEEETPGERAAE